VLLVPDCCLFSLFCVCRCFASLLLRLTPSFFLHSISCWLLVVACCLHAPPRLLGLGGAPPRLLALGGALSAPPGALAKLQSVMVDLPGPFTGLHSETSLQ
jgi:hypothetical protein